MLLKIIPDHVYTHGVYVSLNKNDPVISGALAFGVYEVHETALFIRAVESGMTVVDIGANVGYYTALAAKQVGPKGCVCAIEPDPENFTYLQRTIAQNDFQNVDAYQIALSNCETSGSLFLSTDNKGDHRIYHSPEQRESIKVKLTKLDTLAKIVHLKNVDLIKMDIQGAEALALEGMEQLIKQSGKIILFSEFWPTGLKNAGSSPLTFLSTLTKWGFALYEIDKKYGIKKPIGDLLRFANRFKGREFVNLYCERYPIF